MWKYLPYEDIVSLCQTSRGFSEICNDPETWRFLLYRDFNISKTGSLSELRDLYQYENTRARIYNELLVLWRRAVPQPSVIHDMSKAMIEILFPEAKSTLDRLVSEQITYDYLVKLITDEVLKDESMINTPVAKIIPIMLMKRLYPNQKRALHAIKRREIVTDGDLFRYKWTHNLKLPSLYELQFMGVIKKHPGEYQKSVITLTPEMEELLQ